MSPFRRTLLNSSSLITGLALGLVVAAPGNVALAQSPIPTLAGGAGGNSNSVASTGAGADGTQSGYVGGTGGSAGSTGGDGGNGALGSGQIAPDGGGAGGAVAGAAGGAGQTFLVGGGGGGGGAHGSVGVVLPGSNLIGGAGGAGGGGGDATPGNHNSGSGGGGGGGGFAAVVESDGELGTLTANLTGGAGGAGGDTTTQGYAYGGKGGAGGGGLYLSSTADTSLTIASIVQGGAGGNGGLGSSFGNGASGAGGSAIYGVNSGGTTTLTLTGTAQALGGNAGSVITGATAGAAGPGIAGENLDIILAAGSTVRAGTTSDLTSPRYAIQFTGGTNSLELQGNGGTTGQTYATIDGNVLGSGSTSLKLTGAGGTFDLGLLDPNQGFSNFIGIAVNTTGSWIVGGTAVDAAPWLVAAGTLSNSLTGAQGATLAGDTTIVGGAHLSAHAVPSASAFTIGGDLTLASSTSVLDVTLGLPTSTPLITVNGDLILNGTLNIFNSGSMTPGSYTLIGYTGAYSGAGLTLGTNPDPDLQYIISTTTPNLVSLAVSLNGLYWNGTTTSGSGIAVGGTGTWTALSGMHNWIDPTNTFYVASDPVMSALFTGTAGTVTVDKTDGALSANGLRFETSGYTLTGATVGDTLALATTSGIPRVTVIGDSSVATIALLLTGTQGMEKAGTGKLILTGANSYTGNTTITGGTLQLGDGTTTGSVVGDITNNAALLFNPNGVNARYAGAISGTGTVAKAGTGSLTLSGNSSYTGATSVNGGVLLISANSALGSASGGTVVSSGAMLGLYGNGLTIAEPLTLSGSGVNGAGALVSYRGDSLSAGTNTVSGAITLAANASIVNSGGAGDALKLTGTITGDGKSLTLASGSTAKNTISGQINTGAGSVEISSGSWVFANSTSYTGSTIVASGAKLQFDAYDTRMSGNISNAGTLTLSSMISSFDGVISGSGDIEVVVGSSNLLFPHLMGSNTYTGETRVLNGTLTVRNVRGLGSTDGGTILSAGAQLYIDLPQGSNIMEEPLTISGSGIAEGRPALIVKGGTLAFTGAITLAADATIFAHRTAGNRLDLQGKITSAGKSLTLEGNDSGTEIQTISGEIALGSGGVAIVGGEWIFSGNSSYTGFTTISQVAETGTTYSPGILRVNGKLTSDVFVFTGGGLGGSGTVKSAWFFGGSWLGPGNSPGTLTIDGTLNMDAGSTYQVEVTPTGAHDSVIVTGNVTIANGAILEVIAEPGSYPASTTHTILTTSGTISGGFTSVISDYAFLTPSLSADAKNIFLTLSQNEAPFASYATTANQFSVATAAQTLGVGHPVYDAILPLAKDAVASSFNQLSGEIYPSINSVIQQQSGYLRDAVGARLRQAVTAPSAAALSSAAKADGPGAAPLSTGRTPMLWMQGYGNWGKTSGNGNAATISSNISGFIAGLDMNVTDTVRAGIVGGFSWSQVGVGARNSSGTTDNYDIGLYAGGQFGAFALRAGLSYTRHDVSVRRTVSFQAFTGSTQGDYAIGTTQLFGELGYAVNIGAIELEPFAGLAYLHLSGEAFTESGAQSAGAALAVSLPSRDRLSGSLGARAATSMIVGGQALTPSVKLGWQRAFGKTVSTASMLFQGSATPFQVSGVPIARDTLLMGAGLAYELSDRGTFELSYTGQLARDVFQNAVMAQFSLRF